MQYRERVLVCLVLLVLNRISTDVSTPHGSAQVNDAARVPVNLRWFS
jgi:hypothetical protein